MNRFATIFSGLLLATSVQAQELTLEACYGLALQSSPLGGQKAVYQQLSASKTERLSMAYRPQVNVSGQWSYQSDVFSLPFTVPGSDVPQIPKSQYQATVGIEQNILDGGFTRQSKEVAQRELLSNQQRVEVDLYKVKEAINALYFGILRTQETEKNLEVAANTLAEKFKTIEAGYSSGVLLLSDKASFEKEMLSVEQQLVAVRAEKESLLAMLSDKLAQELGAETLLQIPSGEIPVQAEITRPELGLIEEQKTTLAETNDLITARNKPKVTAFARGGVGSPNPYNFFETDLSTFYIAGVRLYWPLFDWGVAKREQQEVQMQQQLLENSRTDAMQHFENGSLQWRKKWLAANDIITRDADIVRLQESIVAEYAARLEGGTITSADYLAAVDQLTRAKTTARMHEIDKAWYQVQYLTITGKL